ncbi:non-ribosomal peptide synthase, putative [Cordyceps militaris CM01]|uniref:Nonribosomal peptide synthetase cm3A n=1 Tax=Cordyceps militaris (strain CM01) TaxID=983644 RepID=CM3A_CORMM|nr:non-ribosomal peptide synthase, putative [Cordyceps militaris CM01]G3J456.1 RecName: Full=Nonribosomal peptide synthetase cm3A; AltName: Full=Beauveriolides biosynthesis cluster protein A; AltName: Full=Cyclodepsipeptides cm3 biosynthesis cluster protein A [Cordyceps militaris CM01]EGX96627.1 non-ribosomal peptide synthase, putative [Cordyceps militaris CM01]
MKHLASSENMPTPAQDRAPSPSAMQQEIVDMCAQVLGRPITRMRTSKSFVALGGDSLLAIKLMAHCREAGYTISIAKILQTASIEELSRSAECQLISSSGEGPVPDPNRPGEPIATSLSLLNNELVLDQVRNITAEPLEDIQDIFPCSRTQEVFLISQHANPEMYQCVVVAEIKCMKPGLSLNDDRLQNAWICVAQRHPALRTVFIESIQRPGHFDQVIMKHEAVPLECQLSSAQCEESAEGMFSRRVSISKEKGTTGRATILRRSENSAVFRLEVSHALMDGQSFGIIFHDFAQAYLQNELPSPTAFSYDSFVAYQEEIDRESVRAYWSSHLAGAQPTRFPTNGNRKLEDLKTLRFRIELDAAALQKVCLEYDATSANLCQVAWAVVLGSYTGSKDVCFSYVNSGRHAPLSSIENAVGAFVDVMVCRMKLPETAKISQMLSKAKQDVIQGLSHPGSLLFEEKKHGHGVSDLRGNTIITFQMGVRDEESAGSDLQIVMLDEITASDYDISLNIQPCHGGLDIRLDYWLSRIDQEIIESVAESFQTALACMCSDDIPLRDVNVVCTQEIEQLRRRNSYTATEIGSLLHDKVDEQARLCPDALAVQGWDGELTYRALNEEASKLASYLQHLGAQQDILICTCFEKSKWAAISQLAVLKSGAAVVPLGTNQPMKRLEMMITNTGADIVLTTSNFASRFVTLFKHVVVIDGASMAKLPLAATVSCSATPDSLAYVIFTSGSTGVPKGVMLTHDSVSTSLRHSVERLNPGPDTRMLQFSAYTFDAAIYEFFFTWHIGACVCIVSEHDRINRLEPAMGELNVNWALLTPTMAEMISPGQVPSLKHLMLIGEAIKPGVLHRWIDHVELWNGYGPSECSIISSCKLLTRECNTTNIGFPITGAFWVVDATNPDRLAPTGAIGELLIQGSHLARGYLNDEQKTSQAFVPPPAWVSKYAFSGSTRYYRTGDLVQRNKDGSITFVGRRDTQVKLRGQRVEFEDIEQHLKDHDAVVEAAIVLAADGPCQGQLVAVVALEAFISQEMHPKTLSPVDQQQIARAKLQTAILGDWLSDRVPEYMVPTMWIPVTSRLLQTDSGKLDRVRLGRCVDSVDVSWVEAFASAGEELTQEREATTLQLQIRDIWAEILLLSIPQVPINRRSFLSLGGDSILAMKAVSRARTQGITLTVPDILQSKSIAKLTEKLGVPEENFLSYTSASKPFPLSPTQKWYFDRVHPLGSGIRHGYCRSVCLQANQKLAEKHVSTSFSTLVSMHPMLRARFLADAANGWQQQVVGHSDDAYGFAVSHLNGFEEIHDIAESTEQGLNIENGPVFSVQFMHLHAGKEEGKQLLFITGHHLVMDEISLCIIIEDLERLLYQDSTVALVVERPSFQAWVEGIAKTTKEEGPEPTSASLTPGLKPLMSKLDLEFGSLTSNEPVYDETNTKVLQFDEFDTMVLLGNANQALRTEPVELILAALVMSFTTTFPSQCIPVLLEGSRGRSLNHGSIDNSKTVGCFTTTMPLRFPVANMDDAVKSTKQIKNARRNTKFRRLHDSQNRNARNYETISSLNRETMEIFFNFDDSSQQIQEQSTLFKQQLLPRRQKLSTGVQKTRHSEIDVDATILQSRLHVAFHFNHRMNHGSDVERWSCEFPKTLRALVATLLKTPSMLTLSDFPLVELTDQKLKILEGQTLPRVGVQPENVEDMYPCTPMQNGILMSQARSPGMYQTQVVWQLQSPDSRINLDVERIMHAYQTLTDRHPMLRTIFVPRTSNAGDGAFDQIVIRRYRINVVHQVCEQDSVEALLATMTNPSAVDYGDGPNHKFMVYSTPSNLTYGHLVINHALSDGFSLSLLEKELTEAYEGTLTPDSKAPPYSAYLSFLKQRSTKEALQYWINNLESAEACFLPAMVERKIQNESETDIVSLPAPSRRQSTTASLEGVESLRKFSEKHSVTMANVFQLAWALVLSKFVRSDDVLFGYVSSGRDVPVHEAHQIFGPFVNILVSRIKLDWDSSIAESLQSVQKRFFENLGQQRTPLVDIWHALKTGGRGLFNTYLSYRQLSSADGQRSGLFQHTIAILGDSEYDAGVDIVASSNKVSVTLDYLPSFMGHDAATRIVDCLLQTVQSLTQSEAFLLRNVTTTTGQDIRQICQWNSEVPLVTVQHCVHDTVYSKCCLDPSAKAICAWDGDLTYFELDQLGEQLAFYLTSNLSVTPETMIGVCFDKSRWAIVAQLAILKSGGAIVPINPMEPMQRLETILRESGICTLLTTSCYGDRFLEIIPNVVAVDSNSPFFHGAMPTERVHSTANPDNAAVVIHTSGSTGNPKGVVLTHRSIASSLEAQGKIFGLSSRTRTLQFVSYTFDLSIGDIWGTLSHGGCVCVMSEDDRMNNIQGAIQIYGATLVIMTPTVATLLDVSKLPSLETLVLGGEALKPAFVEKHLEARQIKIFNGYGPSECSMITTCNGPIQHKNEAPKIGRPLLGSVWLVDDTDKICPIGAVGEIWVEGPLVARGYLNKKDLTDKGFPVDPPWAASAGLQGKRFYRTGDMARQNAKGDLFYVDRKDWQIKIRGNRVELSEIEHAIKEILSGLQNVAACLVSSNQRGPLIAAVLEQNCDTLGLQADVAGFHFERLSPGFQKELVLLKKALAGVLPSHMIPNLYVPTTRLPLTASGKVNRQALRQSLESFSEQEALHYTLADAAKTLPSSETEKTVRALWAAVLQHELDQVGVEDNFFHLGGDSYLAMRLVASSQADDSRVHFTVSDVLQHPTIRELAHAIDQRSTHSRASDRETARFSLWKEYQELNKSQESGHAKALLDQIAAQCDVPIDDVEDIYPCTPLQEGLMVVTAQQPRAYIARWAFQMPDNINLERFQGAWQTLSRAVPILRTRIVPGRLSGALQVVVRGDCKWHTSHDLDQYLSDDVAQSMAYGTSLIRLAYINHSNGCRDFVWTAHHSIYDGWSLPMLLEALSRIYLFNEVPESFPPYSNFIQYIQAQDLAEATAFWRSELQGNLGEPFPALPKPSYQPEPARIIRCTINVESVNRLVTLASLLRAAWAATVSSHTGGTALFAMPLSGRNAPVKGILDMMAPTVTTVPVRIQVDEKQAVHDYLAAVQQQASNMVPFEHSGLHHVRSMVGRDINPQHLFAIQSAPPGKATFEELLGMKELTLPMDGFDNYALIVECFINSREGASIEILARFDDNVLSHTQVQHLLSRFKHIFGQLSQVSAGNNDNTSSMLMGGLEYISPEEVAQLAILNREVAADAPCLVHDLVLRYSATTPDRPAVCAWDGEMSFQQLDQLSEALANRLVELGVTIESPVMICCDKSKWAVVGILAILRAGGTVVPVRAAPVARLQAIMEATGSRVVVTMSEFISQLQGIADHVVSMDSVPVTKPEIPQGPVKQHPSTKSVSFIMFTSGSTGSPKGIVLEHGSMSIAIQSHVKRFGVNRHTRGFQFASFTFDMSLHDILTPLAGGGCVCLPSEVERVNNLAHAMRRFRVNYSMLTPRVLHTIKPSECPEIRTLLVGGERCDTEQLKLWLPQAKVWHVYGPVECSIISTAAEFTGSDTLSLGLALVGAVWVTNKDNCNQLCPIGAVGELLVEGPLVARGYLRDEAKTSAVFIDYPPWRKQHGLAPNSQSQRMYRTGDLVVQHEDGSLIFVGRADQQLKIRGQRVEVGDIEHHIGLQPEVEDGVVLYPQNGPCRSQLIGLVTLHEHMSATDLSEVQPSSADDLAKAITQTEIIRSRLSDVLPDYMVPNVWISMACLPQSAHHKVDRRKLMDWVQSLDAEYFRRITGAKQEAPEKPTTRTEELMQSVLADVLGLSPEDVSMGRSFLSMGGDSITSMQVVSQCRSRYGLSLHVRDILQSKSITQLAQRATTDAAIAPLLPASDGEFRLSPIQRLFFRSFAARGLQSEDEFRFNQSVCLTVNKHIDTEQIKHAARGVVSAHPMLRARFTVSGKRWRQRIEDDVDASCHVVFHQVENQAELEDVIWAGQRSLSVEQGRVFSVHCIETTTTGSQLLFLVAHHLVVDIVSWQIILRDLDNLIQHPKLTAPVESTTFQHWLQLQASRAQNVGSPHQLVHAQMPIADWSYWGVTPENNTYGHRINEQFILEDCASVLFGDKQPLRSEPVEVLLAALFHSFHQIFPDRAVPTVFNEGHGREPWSDAIDLSNTVGWFTTMTPIHVPVGTSDVVDVLKRTKDLRRSIPERGFAYFTSRFLTRDGQHAFASHDQPEVMFNFGGRYRDDKHSRSLFRMSNEFNSSHISGIGNNVKRIAVFEVEASIQQENLAVTLGFSKNMQNPERITRWIQAYQDSLKTLLCQLSTLPTFLSLADVPLLNITYDDLDRLQSERLPLVGINDIDCIEDIYPCSPAQESILRSQARDSSTFHVRSACEFRAREAVVNPEALIRAWQTVVARHAILRTVCVPPTCDGESFYQAVLKQYEPQVSTVRCETAEDVDEAFKDEGGLRYPKWKPEHQLTLCLTSTGQVFFRLLINHTLVDVSSLQLIMNEVTLAYEDGILDTAAPSFSKYIAFLQESSVSESMKYWTSRLAGAQPHCLPVSATVGDGQSRDNAHLEMSNLEPLWRFRDRYGITIANILQLAWAFVLAKHSGSRDVVFGYVANGRDAPVDGVSHMAGPLINVMVSRIWLGDKQRSVAKTAEQVQNDFMEAFRYQRVSLADIEQVTGLSERQMLHTVVSIVRDPGSRRSSDAGVSVHGQSATSLAEYDVSLNAACGEDAIKLSLEYSSRYPGSVSAKGLLDNLQKAVLDLAENGEASIEEMGLRC